MKWISGVVAVCALAISGSAAQAQNSVVNGSFETPVVSGFQNFANGSVPGWSAYSGAACGGTGAPLELWDSSSIVAQDGVQQMEISSNVASETVCQTVSDLRDCPTTFSFWYTGRPGGYDNSFTATLSGGYTSSVGLTAPDYGTGGWQLYSSGSFVPTGPVTIAFSRNPMPPDAGGAHIDNVRLVQSCPLDHFDAYNVGNVPPAQISGLVTATVENRFVSGSGRVLNPNFLLAPTNKNNEDPTAPTHPIHLEFYKLTQNTFPLISTGAFLQDQFGVRHVNVRSAHFLLVPTAKTLASPAPPAPVDPLVDHFLCHLLGKYPSGMLPAMTVNASVVDQFLSGTAVTVRPLYLCSPANKNGEDPTAPRHADQLTCYRSAPAPLAAKTVWIGNQFGPGKQNVKRRRLLCVPSRILCQGTCDLGANAGQACGTDAQCPGGTCQVPACCCSPNGAQACTVDADCSSHACQCS